MKKEKEEIFIYFHFKLTQTLNELQTHNERMTEGKYRSQI